MENDPEAIAGQELATEKVWLRKTFGMTDSADGQLHRPARSFCKANVEDVALPLGALNAAALDGNAAARQAALQMAEGYLRRLREGDLKDAALHCFSGFSIKSLMVTARLLGSEAAFEAARILVKPYAVAGETLTPDNRFGPRTHTHGMLKTLVGLADSADDSGVTAEGDTKVSIRRRGLAIHFRLVPADSEGPAPRSTTRCCAA